MTHSGEPQVTFFPSKPALPAGQECTFDLLIRIDAPLIEGPRERRPLNSGLVLDRSGSMAGRKLARAKEAVGFAVSNMAPQDRISLTIYDDHVMTLVPSAPVFEARSRLLEALDAVQAGGSTPLHDAWVTGAAGGQRAPRHRPRQPLAPGERRAGQRGGDPQ